MALHLFFHCSDFDGSCGTDLRCLEYPLQRRPYQFITQKPLIELDQLCEVVPFKLGGIVVALAIRTDHSPDGRPSFFYGFKVETTVFLVPLALYKTIKGWRQKRFAKYACL